MGNHPEGTAEDWTDFSLARRSVAGPHLMPSPLDQQLEISNGGASNMVCGEERRLKQS